MGDDVGAQPLPAGELTVQEGRIVETFVSARWHAKAIREYPGPLPADIESAYRCQEAALRQWPDRVAGWKVARIGETWRDRYRDERLIGPVLNRNVRRAQLGEHVECPVFVDGFAAVEAELVIRVNANAPAAKLDWTIDEAIPFVGELCIGVEVASSPLPTLNALGPGAVISDFGNNWGVVLGQPIDNWRDLRHIAVRTEIDGVEVGSSTVDIYRGALGALAFALQRAARRGRPLQRGALISTGMITGVHDILPGQQSRHVFADFGEVLCRAVPALPLPQTSLREF
jgi:2-keto-4-pentenoate hydratase